MKVILFSFCIFQQLVVCRQEHIGLRTFRTGNMHRIKRLKSELFKFIRSGNFTFGNRNMQMHIYSKLRKIIPLFDIWSIFKFSNQDITADLIPILCCAAG